MEGFQSEQKFSLSQKDIAEALAHEKKRMLFIEPRPHQEMTSSTDQLGRTLQFNLSQYDCF